MEYRTVNQIMQKRMCGLDQWVAFKAFETEKEAVEECKRLLWKEVINLAKSLRRSN